MWSKLPAARVFFFATLLFFTELLFFRLLGYTAHYHESMLIIAHALAGVAVGGLLAARIQASETECYVYCLLGSYLTLLLSLWKVLRYPSLGPENIVLIGTFVFPALYIASSFRRYSSGKVYLLDLGGAGFAVVVLYVAHRVSYLEVMFLGTFLLLALLGLLGAIHLEKFRALGLFLFTLLTLISLAGLVYEVRTGRLNLYYVARRSETSRWKDFGTGRPLLRFYDNLIARVEVYEDEQSPLKRYFYASDGMIFDGFRPDYPVRFQRDPRVVGGFFEEPQMYIIGSSAQGILKSARYMTRPERIHGSEINPAVHQIMMEDFVKESGYVFAGLNQEIGNALAVLSRSPQTYDIITLMNPHSAGQMFLQGPPDWLHTVESYELYLRNLTPDGYIMVEERPMQPPGFQIVLKRLATICQALKNAGAENPEQHLFVYSWHWNRYQPYRDFTPKVFTSVFVKKAPLTDDDKLRLMDWLRITGPRWTDQGKKFLETSEEERAASPIRFDYLPGVFEREPYQRFFSHLRAGDVEDAYPDWDLSPVTNDKPFSAAVSPEHRDVVSILQSTSWLAGLLLIPVVFSFRRTRKRILHARLHLYQFLAGAAYILIEVFLMQLYQNYVLSASVAFVSVLSVLLMSSGLGGQFLCHRGKPGLIWLALSLSLLLHIGLARAFALGWFPSQFSVLALLLSATACSGFLMGAFLPMGLEAARGQGQGDFVADYFATNSLGGTVALALSLYLPLVWGFQATAAVAVGCYLLVVLSFGRLAGSQK